MNLNFNVRVSGRKSKLTCFSKASAKVQLFFELTKYFAKKMHLKMHFLCKSLIISGRIFDYFSVVFRKVCCKAENLCIFFRSLSILYIIRNVCTRTCAHEGVVFPKKSTVVHRQKGVFCRDAGKQGG